jgi:hypothetical protein
MQTMGLSKFTLACVLARPRGFAATFSVAFAMIVGAGPAAAYESAYYESYVQSEIAALSLTVPGTQIGVHLGNATNIAIGGGKIYFQDGVDIYSANPDLSGVTLFRHNGAAPTDIAVDASAGVFYESFEGSELAALSLADPKTQIAVYLGNATNITVGGGKVYFQDGVNIDSANPNLSGVTLYRRNGAAPTDIAVDAGVGVFYESFEGSELAALSVADPNTQLAVYLGNATNLAVGGGKVYFQDGVNIDSAYPNLVGLALLHANAEAPTDFAVDSHFAPPPPVPEPSTYALMMIGVLALATLKGRHVRAGWSRA